MKMDGYNLTVDGIKVASLTTGLQADGTYEVYVHLMAGPRVERHLHAYAKVDDASGEVLSGGARLKHDVDDHPGPPVVVVHTTQEIARLIVTRERGGLRSELQQRSPSTSFEIGSTGVGTITRRACELPSASGAARAEYSIAMFDPGTRFEPNATDRIVLPTSSPRTFGLSITLVSWQ